MSAICWAFDMHLSFSSLVLWEKKKENCLKKKLTGALLLFFCGPINLMKNNAVFKLQGKHNYGREKKKYDKEGQTCRGRGGSRDLNLIYFAGGFFFWFFFCRKRPHGCNISWSKAETHFDNRLPWKCPKRTRSRALASLFLEVGETDRPRFSLVYSAILGARLFMSPF